MLGRSRAGPSWLLPGLEFGKDEPEVSLEHIVSKELNRAWRLQDISGIRFGVAQRQKPHFLSLLPIGLLEVMGVNFLRLIFF